MDERDFRLLHQAMLDAVDPDGSELSDYYRFRVEREDGGYLRELVQTCRNILHTFPHYSSVSEEVKRWVGLYADLQVYKHLDWSVREQRLAEWWSLHRGSVPGLMWNEFAAATGSTLGVFVMFAIAASSDGIAKLQIREQAQLFFPWMCGLHILLDYVIDQEEDRNGGDLNFCFYYESGQQMVDRLQSIIRQTRAHIPEDALAPFHRMTVEGLLAVYLSDPKVRDQKDLEPVRAALMQGSPLIRMFFWLNSVWVRRTRPQIGFG
jgi:tetraprenyl-beta-curcumene synthase